MAKPDDRSNNAERLQQHLDDTEQNLHEAEQYLNEFAGEISADEKQAIEAKNERRKQSIQGFAEEMKDEAGQ
ncbi:small acid-soluble spore protein Tlp [Paenibacillus arenilitoris]|uniref:Small acid-soluble spore protein Tlp n=1 Tax=Paenibacillus arenilitoris TaxID=2772299 RepID=A0A927CP42_9BACL|nr:small acid-soluble spore protein Tlp [Paenibacillus arenilitoris]MBD2870188.1 small acid-soluble spore protein Tlp [Paenibacillus arenilitoris]